MSNMEPSPFIAGVFNCPVKTPTYLKKKKSFWTAAKPETRISSMNLGLWLIPLEDRTWCAFWGAQLMAFIAFLSICWDIH